jgi:hypothetical protein
MIKPEGRFLKLPEAQVAILAFFVSSAIFQTRIDVRQRVQAVPALDTGGSAALATKGFSA